MTNIAIIWVALSSAVFSQANSSSSDEGNAAATQTGFLVVVPDRGFAGNETVRDAVVPLASSRNAEVVFITDERSGPYIGQAMQRLKAAGASEIVVLPLFISTAHSQFELARKQLRQIENEELPVHYTRAFGESYLAVEMLVQRIRDAQVPDGHTVVVASQGAQDKSSAKGMSVDLLRIAALVAPDVGKVQILPVVWPARNVSHGKVLEKDAWRQIEKFAAAGTAITVIPFHFGQRLDSMMSFDAWLSRRGPEELNIFSTHDDEGLFFSLWVQREANRYLSAKGDRPGVVFLAHGADFHWNQTMRDSVQELARRYPMEFAFSMADSPSIRRAVDRLEVRGVAAIVIVRVFGMPDSFRAGIERLIGQDVETDSVIAEIDHVGHGSMPTGQPAPRLRTTTMVATAGGLGDHPIFARALFDRARALSVDPANETIILAAHGQGDEETNRRWVSVLASLASQMRFMGGDIFRDVLYQTWREDWPDERAPRINSIRTMVQVAQQDGGSAIIVAARTTGTGPADSFLEGLEYRLAPGFAPHPLFSQWVEAQIEVGLDTIRESTLYSSDDSNALNRRGTDSVVYGTHPEPRNRTAANQ